MLYVLNGSKRVKGGAWCLGAMSQKELKGRSHSWNSSAETLNRAKTHETSGPHRR